MRTTNPRHSAVIVPVDAAGLFGAGIVQLGLGAIGLRGLYWALLPILLVAAVIGVLLYAKEVKGSLRDA